MQNSEQIFAMALSLSTPWFIREIKESNKKLKTMKTILKILFLCGIIVLTAFSCEKDKENVEAGDLEPIDIKEITDFGCDNCSITLKSEYVNNGYYVIYSENGFNKYVQYVTGENIPSIDFNKYFLIIGVKQFTSGAEILQEKAEENNIEIVYYVTFLTDDSTVAVGVGYHAFLEKPIKEKAVRIEMIIEP